MALASLHSVILCFRHIPELYCSLRLHCAWALSAYGARRNQLQRSCCMADQSSPASDSASSAAEKKNSSQFVGFQIADQQYAFRIEQIQEIVILDQVTKTPQVPDYVEGVSNLRGSIIPIINLRKLFGLTPSPPTATRVRSSST